MTGKDRSTDGDTTDTRRTVEPPQSDERFAVPLCGVEVDAETRCAHYDTAADVVALRFPCCDCYYPCFRCHAAVTDHEPERVRQAAFDDSAVLCGGCGATLSVRSYLDCEDACPACDAAFNPGCRRHRDRYFAVEG